MKYVVLILLLVSTSNAFALEYIEGGSMITVGPDGKHVLAVTGAVAESLFNDPEAKLESSSEIKIVKTLKNQTVCVHRLKDETNIPLASTLLFFNFKGMKYWCGIKI